MIAARTAPPRLDLPLGGDASGRFLPWIIALMVYLSGLGGVGLMVLGGVMHDWNRPLTDTLTLEVPADTSPARLEVVMALLRQTPGVASAHALGPDETAHLVDFRVATGAAIDLAALERKLQSVVPGFALPDPRRSSARWRGFALQVDRVVAAIVAAGAALLTLTVVFATRIGLAIHQPVVEILHLLGAADGYIAARFQAHALSLGLRGGALGAAAAAVTIAILGRAGAALRLPFPIALTDWRMWGLLALTVLAAGLIATITARVTILCRLGRLP